MELLDTFFFTIFLTHTKRLRDAGVAFPGRHASDGEQASRGSFTLLERYT